MCRHIGIDSSAAPPEGRILTLRLEVRHRAEVGEQPAAVAGHVHVAAVDGGAPVLPVVPHHGLQPGACEVSEKTLPFVCRHTIRLSSCVLPPESLLATLAALSPTLRRETLFENSLFVPKVGTETKQKRTQVLSLFVELPQQRRSLLQLLLLLPRRLAVALQHSRLRVFKSHSVRRPRADLHAAAV